MNSISKEPLESSEVIRPMRLINGFPVRPGFFDMNGATALNTGVNFTIHTHRGTSCELLLFHEKEWEPYAVTPQRP